MANEKLLVRRSNEGGELTAVYYTYEYPKASEAVELNQTNGWHVTVAGRKNIRALARALAKAGGLEVTNKKSSR